MVVSERGSIPPLWAARKVPESGEQSAFIVHDEYIPCTSTTSCGFGFGAVLVR